jgi:hypothetical protein
MSTASTNTLTRSQETRSCLPLGPSLVSGDCVGAARSIQDARSRLVVERRPITAAARKRESQFHGTGRRDDGRASSVRYRRRLKHRGIIDLYTQRRQIRDPFGRTYRSTPYAILRNDILRYPISLGSFLDPVTIS